MKRYIKSDNYICRKLLDKIILFPINEETSELQGGILLNNVSYYIWELLLEPKTQIEIEEAVSCEFNVSIEIIEQDIKELLVDFIEMRVIVTE